jgi:hypothetical protein
MRSRGLQFQATPGSGGVYETHISTNESWTWWVIPVILAIVGSIK